jgi:hypothetical protein
LVPSTVSQVITTGVGDAEVVTVVEGEVVVVMEILALPLTEAVGEGVKLVLGVPVLVGDTVVEAVGRLDGDADGVPVGIGEIDGELEAYGDGVTVGDGRGTTPT